MQTLLLPSARSGAPPLRSPLSGAAPAVTRTLQSSLTLPLHNRRTPVPSQGHDLFSSPDLASSSSIASSSSLYSLPPLKTNRNVLPFLRNVSSSASADFNASIAESDQAKLAQVAKRLEKTASYFKRLGSFGFWGQLISTIVAAVILSFSVVITGKITSPFTFYATTAGIAAAFISVFWSFGYLRLAEKLRKTATQPSKAPPRADVVKSLKNGIVLNLLGMGAAILGMQATVGLLVGKSLTSSTNPFYQGVSPGYSPVLALDVFLVQASANTILSHFLGLASSLELLRSVTLPPNQVVPVAKVT